jgi:hypothetical protein
MPIQFPPSPSVNQEYAYEGKVWAWDGSSWVGVRQETGIQKSNIWAKQSLLIPKRGFGLNSGYNGTTDQRRTTAGTIPTLKHYMERDLGLFANTLNVIYESLTYIITGNATVTGNGTDTVNIFKISGSAGWNSQAYSLTPFTAPCTIEFNKQAEFNDNTQSYAMIGWNEDPTASASYESIDHASYPYRTTAYEVYNNGTRVDLGAWSTANKFYLVYGTDGTIKHYNGSTLLYSANYGAGKTVYVDTSLYAVNATYGGFSNVKVIKLTWNGTAYV